MVQCLPGSAIWTVPCPVKDKFLGKPGICNTEVVVVAEQEKVISIIICRPVCKNCANRGAGGPITNGRGGIGINENDGNVMGWSLFDSLFESAKERVLCFLISDIGWSISDDYSQLVMLVEKAG